MKKHTVLIVDDVEFNRSWLVDMLSGQYEVLEAENGMEAVALLEKYHTEISLVLLDIVMPVMDGFEVLGIMNRSGGISEIPVITISSETSSEYIDRAYSLGATDYISRPFDENTVQHRVQNTIMLYSKQKTLESMVAQQILEKEHNNSIMVEILSNIVEFRNGESGQHVLNIRKITELLLHQLVRISDAYPLSPAEIGLIVNASSLHDIGKISIPEEILNKPGKLTAEEFEVIKGHSAIGAEVLGTAPYRQGEPLVKFAHDICRWHHERYDGKGYPDGLKGEEIPIAAQVVALADVYDALTSVRVYKPPFPHDQAMEMILNGECGVFNPVLLQCIVEVGPYLQEKLSEGTYSEAAAVNAQTGRVPGQLLPGGQVSGRTLSLLEQEAREAGVNGFLPKPLYRSSVYSAIRDALENKNQHTRSGGQTDNRPALDGIRLLMAEDNELNQEIAVELLQMNGAEVVCADDGQQALDLFLSSEPGCYDAILMDVQMPVMNGHEATRRIRASDHPAAMSIPIIATTANAFSDDITAALGAGMNAHISKPLDVEQLCRVLKECMQKAKAD